MKWQTKLTINQVTAVKKTNSEKSVARLKTTRLKKHPLEIFFDVPCQMYRPMKHFTIKDVVNEIKN